MKRLTSPDMEGPSNIQDSLWSLDKHPVRLNPGLMFSVVGELHATVEEQVWDAIRPPLGEIYNRIDQHNSTL